MFRTEPLISFIVPALNEEANLPPLFERLLAIGKTLDVPVEILVIDDASTDRTADVAESASRIHPEIRCVRKPLPHGLGTGVRAALDHARGVVGVVVMADGVDPLETATPQFCRKILAENCDLVLLSRYTNDRDARSIPASYKFFHVIFRFFTMTVLGVPFRDTTYAFRAFHIPFLRGMRPRSTGFEISPEVTFKTYFYGGKIGEVAGSQTRRVRGKSKFLFSKAAMGYGRVLSAALLMRLRGTKARTPREPLDTLQYGSMPDWIVR